MSYIGISVENPYIRLRKTCVLRIVIFLSIHDPFMTSFMTSFIQAIVFPDFYQTELLF